MQQPRNQKIHQPRKENSTQTNAETQNSIEQQHKKHKQTNQKRKKKKKKKKTKTHNINPENTTPQ